MEVSVVVPIYITNEEQVRMTDKCLSLAQKNTNIPFKLIIVETQSRSFFNYYSDLYLWEKEVTTSTASMNRAFSLVDTKYTTLLTNDVYVGDGWLEALLDCFKQKQECGVATLGSTQFAHTKRKFIEPDGIWFSVAMWETNGKVFDERFKNVWDDTDFTMRLYLDGKRSYRNHACICEHLIGKTQYVRTDHNENFRRGKVLFNQKYAGCDNPMFERLR